MTPDQQTLRRYAEAVRSLREVRETDEALLAFSFSPRPLFRMGFDRHVWLWRKYMQRQVWIRYHRSLEFAAAYDADLGRWYAGARAA